jgi:hypothetical protein
MRFEKSPTYVYVCVCMCVSVRAYVCMDGWMDVYVCVRASVHVRGLIKNIRDKILYAKTTNSIEVTTM